MGYKLRREVRDALPPGTLTAAERLLVLELADWCNDKTRTGWPGAELLAELTDLSPRSIQETLSRIAEKWIELRVQLGTTKSGKPYYSHAGKRTTFRFPKLTPVKGAIDQGASDAEGATDPGASADEGATDAGASTEEGAMDPGGRCDESVSKVRQIRGPSPHGSSSVDPSNISLSLDHPTAPASGETDPEDRERDGSASPSTPDYQVLAEEGVDRNEAATLIPIIIELYEVRSPGFWRHVQRNRDIVGILARARAAAAGTVQPGQMVAAGREVQPYGAEVNRQPRTSERGRLSAGARKFTDAHRLADELDAEWASVANRPDYEPEVTP